MFSGNKNMKPATKVDAELMMRDKKVIENFVKNADVPEWYRGLSSFQIAAAFQLQYAIRDDLEEGTTHRVKSLLNRIGLRPTLRSANIRLVMFLSGGNDLAFLWFVNELFFKTETRSYSVNEQLVLSSVARLDMLFTLRGLDSILPPEQPTKSELRQMEIAKHKIAKKHLESKSSSSENKTVNSIRVKYKLPYFDELVRPRLYEHSLTAEPREYRTKMQFADVLRDSNHIIPNATNRWFADYNLHPGKRTGVKMLTEKMNEMFKEKLPRRSDLEKNVFIEHVFKNVRMTKVLQHEYKDDKMQESLCLHHKTLIEMEKMLEHELRVRAREKCLKYFDSETPKREERIARIRSQIEADVKTHMVQFKKLADRTRSHLQLWSQDEIHECDSKAEIRLRGGAQNKLTKSETVIQQSDDHRVKQNIPLNTKSDDNIHSISANKTYQTQESIGDCLNTRPQMSQKTGAEHKRKRESSSASKIRRVRDILHHIPCDCGYGYMRNYDYGHSEQSQHKSHAYFKAPEENKPYMFDYPKVFDFKHESARLNVQTEFLKVITSDLNLNKNDPDAPKNLDEAIKQYAKKSFKENVAAKNEEMAEQEKRNEATKRRYPFLDVELDYYDPDDEKLMQSMLKNALDLLANDTKYVLASMPDAHKLPSLLAWMETRYGKAYSREQLLKVHKTSLPTFHALKKMSVDVMMPSPKLLGGAILVNYNCRDYLMKKTEMLRKDYYDRVNASIMDQSRTFYMAIKPNICGYTRDTFFAYMPSREADIQQFRIWRSHEYMPAKEEFFKRKCRAMKFAGRFY